MTPEEREILTDWKATYGERYPLRNPDDMAYMDSQLSGMVLMDRKIEMLRREMLGLFARKIPPGNALGLEPQITARKRGVKGGARMIRWNDRYDSAFLALYRRGLTDPEITGFMLDQGFPVDRRDVNAARCRMGLAPNVHPKANQATEPHIASPTRRGDPMRIARVTLDDRMQVSDNGFRLDGVPVKLMAIMQEAYRVRLMRDGFAPAGWPDHWIP